MISSLLKLSTLDGIMNRQTPLTILAGAFLLAVAVFSTFEVRATTVRIASLGGGGDYFEDEANVKSWYGSLVDYPNLATLDFGHFNIYYGYHDDAGRTISGPSLSIHQDLGGQWGQVYLQLNAIEGDANTGSLYRDDLEGAFSLMYARLVGPVQIGLMYRQGSGEKEGTDTAVFENYLTRSKLHQLGLGLRMDLSESAYLDLVGEIRNTREEFLPDGNSGSEYSGDLESTSDFSVRGRLFLKLGERTALVPLIEYHAADRPVQPQSIGYFPAIDGHLFRLGCGLDFYSDTDHFIYAAGEWNRGSTLYKYGGFIGQTIPAWTNDWNTYSLLVGWESRFLPWMTLRSSAGYYLSRGKGTQQNPMEEDIQFDYDDLRYTLGAGFHLGAFDLDAALSENEPFPFYGDWGVTYRGYRTTYLSVALRWMY